MVLLIIYSIGYGTSLLSFYYACRVLYSTKSGMITRDEIKKSSDDRKLASYNKYNCVKRILYKFMYKYQILKISIQKNYEIIGELVIRSISILGYYLAIIIGIYFYITEAILSFHSKIIIMIQMLFFILFCLLSIRKINNIIDDQRKNVFVKTSDKIKYKKSWCLKLLCCTTCTAFKNVFIIFLSLCILSMYILHVEFFVIKIDYHSVFFICAISCEILLLSYFVWRINVNLSIIEKLNTKLLESNKTLSESNMQFLESYYQSETLLTILCICIIARLIILGGIASYYSIFATHVAFVVNMYLLIPLQMFIMIWTKHLNRPKER